MGIYKMSPEHLFQIHSAGWQISVTRGFKTEFSLLPHHSRVVLGSRHMTLSQHGTLVLQGQWEKLRSNLRL